MSIGEISTPGKLLAGLSGWLTTIESGRNDLTGSSRVLLLQETKQAEISEKERAVIKRISGNCYGLNGKATFILSQAITSCGIPFSFAKVIARLSTGVSIFCTGTSVRSTSFDWLYLNDP